MNLIPLCAFTLIAQSVHPQDAAPDAVLAKFGLKPTLHFTATAGKATLAPGETIELVGACDLSRDPVEEVWDASGHLLDGAKTQLFWEIMDLPEKPINIRKEYGLDKDKRTFAMAFRLAPSLVEANDLREDVNSTVAVMLSETRPAVGTGASAYVGERRIIKPILPKEYKGNTFDFRLEVPGGDWVNLADFPFGKDTTLADGAIDVKMRWQSYSDFKTVDDRQIIVDYKGYFFTVTLPAALREMELEIVSNDQPEDAKLLPSTVKQHFRGEDYDKAFVGKDLFTVYGLTSRSAERKFTLRARPKRIVEFKDVPFRRGPLN
jgi:hypothetical protein